MIYLAIKRQKQQMSGRKREEEKQFILTYPEPLKTPHFRIKLILSISKCLQTLTTLFINDKYKFIADFLMYMFIYESTALFKRLEIN